MKKLMITACAVAVAAMTQASSVSWENKSLIYQGGASSSVKVDNASKVFLMAATAAYSQADFIKAFADFGGSAADFAASSTAWNTAVQIGTTVTSTATGGSGKFIKVTSDSTVFNKETGYAYFVIINGDNLFVSNVRESAWTSTDDKYTFTYNSSGQGNVDIKAASQAAIMDASAGLGTAYSGAGWYANVPEPTSGLLLLLGVAGLALKRRRA